MITNYTMARRLSQHLDRVGLNLPQAKPEPGMGSTDWGNVSYVVPSVETGFPILDRVCTWHSQEVVDAAASELGYANTLAVARAMALTGVDLIVEPHLLAAVKEEFNRAKAAGLPEALTPIARRPEGTRPIGAGTGDKGIPRQSGAKRCFSRSNPRRQLPFSPLRGEKGWG